MASRRSNRVILVEPEINPITRRFGLPIIANYPPLAQVRLAGQIGDGVDIVDLRIPGERQHLLKRIRHDPPALLAISVTFTSNGDEAIDLAAAARRAAPDLPIVLGGSAPSEDPISFYDSAVDLIGFRAGDRVLVELVHEIRDSGRLPDRFPGFFHREGGNWRLEPGHDAPSIKELKPNAWDALPRRYWRHYYQGMRPTGIGQTSEGCPFDCTFCSVWITHGRRVNLAALSNVQHDLRSLPGMVRGFFFADDIWMQASEPQIRELYDPLFEWVASEFLPRRGDFWMTAETRTDLYLRQEARFEAWIRRGGLRWIFFGVEAVTDAQLREFSKRNTVDVNSEAMRRASEAGAWVTAQFVIPCEADRIYFDELVRFLREHRRWIRVANFTIVTPLPGTVLYRQVLPSHPELADRSAVRHPAFSLFTALMPTLLAPEEFYQQVARVYREANQIGIRAEAIRQWFLSLRHSPWLIPRLVKIPNTVRALTTPATFLQTHRDVQGERLLSRAAAPFSAPATV